MPKLLLIPFSETSCISAPGSDVSLPNACFSAPGYYQVATKPRGECLGTLQIFSWSEHKAPILKADTLLKMQLLSTYGFSLPGMVKLYWFFMASFVTMEIDGFLLLLSRAKEYTNRRGGN